MVSSQYLIIMAGVQRLYALHKCAGTKRFLPSPQPSPKGRGCLAPSPFGRGLG